MASGVSLESGGEMGWLTPERERRLLILFFVLGFFLRAYPILWSSAHYDSHAWGFHPDEPKLVRHVDDFPESIHTYEDYRYPTLIPFAYGAVWMGVGGALDLRDPEASMPGTPSYEAALLFSRGLTLLLFGLGGMWLTWAFTKRLFGPGPALFALGSTNLMGLPMTSASLVQTDVPSIVLLLASFYLLLRLPTAVREWRVRDLALVGLTLGVAAAAKYTAVIGALLILYVIVTAALRKETTWRAGSQLLFTAGLASIVGLLLFVPGILYDFENFQRGLNYELHSKVLENSKGLTDFWEVSSRSYRVWVLVPAAIGLCMALKRHSSPFLGGLLACMAAYSVVWSRRLMPDHAIFFFPFVAAFAGLFLWWAFAKRPRGVVPLCIAALFLLGHGYSGWIVHQRYADLRYQLSTWIQENVSPGTVGVSPSATRPLSVNQLPEGYELASVHTKPEWIVVYKKHYNLVRRVKEDPEKYLEEISWQLEDHPKDAISLEPGARRMGRLRERDFRFYEDVMQGEKRVFDYDEVLYLESAKLPLDHQERPIYVFRRAGAGD